MRISKQNKIVVGVIAFILALTVGYALFSESLNINGTAKASGDFGLEFVSVDAIRKEGYTDTSSNGSASEEEIKQKIASIVDVNGKRNRKLNVTVDKLNYPGAYVEIDATIKNVGTIDAILKGIEVTSENGVVNDKTISNDDIEITYTGVNENDVMKADENDSSNKRQITIKVKWKESSANKSPAALSFNIGLNFEQATGNLAGGTTGGDEFKFPVVEGQLGDNVFFKYDDGAIDITGSGLMNDGIVEKGGYCDYKTGDSNDYCSIGEEIAVKAVEMLNIKNENVKVTLPLYVSYFIQGMTFDDMGMTPEEFKEMLKMPEADGGANFTEEEATEFVKILGLIPRLKSVTIENGITSLRSELLSFFKIDSLTIPNTVNQISENAIQMGFINTLILEDGTRNVLSNLIGIECNVSNVVIPEGVTTIETNALKINELATITIPSTVTSIELGAMGSPDLTTIINKTGRAFDWKGILSIYNPPIASGELFETGTVEYNGRTINIITG